jgi:hypothetical protein
MSVLWRKEAGHFEVEIKVGNTWVQHSTNMLYGEAQETAKTALDDPSIQNARILEHSFKHVCSMVDELEANTVIRVPPKMRRLDQEIECPRCKLRGQLATDGDTEWVFCGPCNGAYPRG